MKYIKVEIDWEDLKKDENKDVTRFIDIEKGVVFTLSADNKSNSFTVEIKNIKINEDGILTGWAPFPVSKESHTNIVDYMRNHCF